MYAASSKSFMVKKPWGFSLVRMLDCTAVLNVSRHTCHYPEGLWQTPPIPVREESVAPIYEEGCGLISCRCVGMAANDATIWRHAVSSSWTGVGRFIRSPFAVFRAC